MLTLDAYRAYSPYVTNRAGERRLVHKIVANTDCVLNMATHYPTLIVEVSKKHVVYLSFHFSLVSTNKFLLMGGMEICISARQRAMLRIFNILMSSLRLCLLCSLSHTSFFNLCIPSLLLPSH